MTQNKWDAHTGIYQEFSFINVFVEKPDKEDVETAVGFLEHHNPAFGCIDVYDIRYIVENATNCIVLNGKGLSVKAAIDDALSHMDSVASDYDISTSQKILMFFTVPKSKIPEFIEEWRNCFEEYKRTITDDFAFSSDYCNQGEQIKVMILASGLSEK